MGLKFRTKNIGNSYVGLRVVMVFSSSSDSQFDFCSWFLWIWELGSTCSLVLCFFFFSFCFVKA